MDKTLKPLDRLVAIMRALRHPETGCAWDRAQTFETIIPHTIEEVFEVADALDRGDMDDFRDELGDLLLQVVFQSQIACDAGLFTLDDVASAIADKLVHRHPHVFGDAEAKTANDVKRIWDIQKDKENDRNGPPASLLDGVTRGLPALLRAEKLQKKAAKIGFEWDHPQDVLTKLEEETIELRAALNGSDKAAIEEELGDVLFVIVNFARMLDLQAEDILRKANAKFERRFRAMELAAKNAGEDFATLTLAQQETYWQQVKTKEKQTVM